MSGYSGVVQSQDTYVARNVPLTVIGAGGGGSNIPANLQVSTVSVLGLSNLSSVNGAPYVAPSANPAFSTISTLAINGLLTINGNPYVSSIPANFTNNSISTQHLWCSSINDFQTDDIPYIFTQNGGLVDSIVSSISVAQPNIITAATTSGARLTGNISTIPGRSYIVSGCMRVAPYLSTGFPAGAPNATLSIIGGGFNGYLNAITWTYPQISTIAGIGAAGNVSQTDIDVQWSAPGQYTLLNQQSPAALGNSTITYYALCSPDWPTPTSIKVSSLVGAITNLDQNLIKVVDVGLVYVG
jgi:hypothetical protein